MREALELAQSSAAIADPNPHVGCVLVKNAKMLGAGATQAVGFAHAEVVALAEAGDAADGATAYVTLEPCAHQGRTPPCVNALIKAKVAKVIIACADPNPLVAGKSIEKFRQAGIECETGLLANEAQTLNRGFIKRMHTGVPFVTAKMGVSVDGRSAIATGDSNWISNAQSRADAHQYRSSMSAIVTTANTVLADDPRLTARDQDDLYPRQPLRIVLDAKARVPNSAKVFHQPGNTLLIVAGENLSSAQKQFSDNARVEVMALSADSSHFELHELMQELGRREINNVLLEAGAEFQGQCIAAGIVDELRMYLAPMLLGRSPFGIVQLPELASIQDRQELKLQDVKTIVNDVRLIYHFQK